MKSFKICAALLAGGTVVLASCKNDNAGDGVTATSTETQNIAIRIDQQSGARSVSDPAAEAGETVTFSDGNLFLTKSNGEILYVYDFSSSASTNVNDATPGRTISISDAVITAANQDGVTIKNISGDVRMAYIVGNTSSFDSSLSSQYDAGAVVGSNISAIKAMNITPAMQFDATDEGLAKVTLYGEGTVVQSTTYVGDETQKEVVIDLYPHVARIEITDITGGGDITSFHVNGIYINNYYPTMSLNFSPGTIINQGQGGTTVYDAGSTFYTSDMSGIIFDSDKNSYFNNTSTTLTKVADASSPGKVWAYNVLAAPVVNSDDPMYSALDVPTTLASQIIVQVQDVAVEDGTDYSGFKYVTVNKLYEYGTNNEITHFKAGYIYTIEAGDFEFDKSNVKDEANLEEIDLQVLVKPITWTVQRMTPELQ